MVPCGWVVGVVVEAVIVGVVVVCGGSVGGWGLWVSLWVCVLGKSRNLREVGVVEIPKRRLYGVWL